MGNRLREAEDLALIAAIMDAELRAIGIPPRGRYPRPNMPTPADEERLTKAEEKRVRRIARNLRVAGCAALAQEGGGDGK